MSLQELTERFSWTLFTKKTKSKMISARAMGNFTKEDAEARKMHFAQGSSGSIAEGNFIAFYWLVDPTDGIIVDAKFQIFAEALFIALAEIGTEIVIGKNYDQANHIGAELIDKQLRDQKEIPAFGQEHFSHLNLVIDAIGAAAEQCAGIALAESYTTPMNPIVDAETSVYPGWESLVKKEKLKVIEEVLDEQIRPYIELDEGGVEVLDLVNDKELLIAYQGACTTCYSAVGTTLSSIQQILQSNIHPTLTVIPNMDELTFT